MGGCSATNACFALRGWPQDYDQWAASGNRAGRSLICCRSSAPSSPTPISAATGTVAAPVPIRRPSVGQLSPLQRAFADAAAAAGHQLVGDHNEPGTVGVGPAPRNVRDGLRALPTAGNSIARSPSDAITC